MPVGVPEEPETVSVKVTDWPKFDGLGDEVRCEVLPCVVAELTTWATTLEVEAVKLVPEAG